MWEEVRVVFWLEYRRHIRSRLFWRLLLLIAGISLSASLLCALLISLLKDSAGMGTTISTLSMGLITVLGVVALIAPAVVVPRIFNDLYKTRELHDLYMTTLHPVAIVTGRLLTVGVQVGLVLLTLFPAGLLIGQIGGLTVRYWLTVLLMTWLALLGTASLMAHWQGKWFPSDRVGALVGQPSNATSGAVWLGIASLVVLLRDVWLGGGQNLPFYLMLAPVIPYKALALCPLGKWELPLWLLALPMMAWVIGLAVLSTAQWLGWWSDRAYRWHRIGATAVFLLSYGVHLLLYAQGAVRSPTDAERVTFWGMVVGCLLYIFFFVRLFGYYGMGIHPLHTRFRLSPPLGGVVWEWGLFAGIALSAWLGVGIGSGDWAPLSRWLAWSGCMLSLLLLAQAFFSSTLVRYWLWLRQPLGERHLNWADLRVALESIGANITRTFLSVLAIGWIVAWLPQLFPHPMAHLISSWLRLLNPLNGLSSPWHPLAHYGGYLVYALLLAAVLTVQGVRKGYSQYTQQMNDRG
jgi:hypothetical protein